MYIFIAGSLHSKTKLARRLADETVYFMHIAGVRVVQNHARHVASYLSQILVAQKCFLWRVIFMKVAAMLEDILVLSIHCHTFNVQGGVGQ